MTVPSQCLRLPTLRPDQWRIVSHPAPTKVVVMGRRWGKSTMAGAVSLAGAARGAAVAWVVPTYRNGSPLWRWIERAVAPLQSRVQANKSERVASFPGGGFVGIYSADNPDSILGEAFDLVVVDEAARVAESVWTETLMPTLADRNGRALLISTPKGRNWFCKEFESADGHSIAAFTAPSADNPNPNIQRAALLAKERVSDRVYRQEWLAEFIADGSIFRNVRECATLAPQPPLSNHQYVMGIDWGRSADFTAIAVFDVTAQSLAHIERFTGVEYAIQISRITALSDRYKPDVIIAEANNMGRPLIEHMQLQGLPVEAFITSNLSKARLVDALALALEQKSIGLLADEALIGELQAYDGTTLAGGLTRYAAPEGQHDDLVMALLLAYQPSGQPRGGNLVTFL